MNECMKINDKLDSIVATLENKFQAKEAAMNKQHESFEQQINETFRNIKENVMKSMNFPSSNNYNNHKEVF